jgi:SAM-dependent methyltransferase
VYLEIRGKYATVLKEDFCGTFRLSAEWIKRNRKNRAISLDLDSEALQYGLRIHQTELSAPQKKRLKLLKQDVRKSTRPLADMAIACNFSFFIFKKRQELLQYFRASRKSLKKDGILILEMAGGPGMIKTMSETRKVTLTDKKKFTYVWHQKSFDPITHDALYAIHFRVPHRGTIKDAFTYDWRLWSIPEVRDLLSEAGFKNSVVYWESEHKGQGTGEFVQMKSGDNSYAWIAYVVGTVN